MADIGAVTPALSLNSLIAVRPMSSGVSDAGAQGVNMLRAQVGQLVQGTIFGMDGSGEPMMKSDQGDLALKLPFHLPSGSSVVLRMENAAGAMRARILSIDGMTLKDYTARLTAGAQEGGGTRDIVSIPAALAQAAAKPGSVLAEQQHVQQQASILPGETNPALEKSVRQVNPLSSLPVSMSGADAARLIPVNGDFFTAMLLSRNPQLPELLAKLPPGLDIPARLQPGTGIRMQLVSIEKTASPPADHAQATLQNALASPTSNMASPMALNQMLSRLAVQQQAQARSNAPMASALPSIPASVMSAENSTTPVPPAAAASRAMAAPSVESIPAPAASLRESPVSPTVLTTAPDGLPSHAKGSFGGQVIDIDRGGGALVQTIFGVVRVPAGPVDLREGDRVQWQLQGFTAPAAAQHTQDPTTRMLGLATRWDSLEETVDWLAATQGLAAAAASGPQSLLAHLPQPDGRMGAAIAFLVAALRRNEPESWIGKNTVAHLVQQKRGDLLGALESDFTLLRQPLVDSPSAQWQALFFPVYVDQQLHQARLFIHRDPEEDEAGGKSEGSGKGDVRFVLELELSALGNIQLCGLVRKAVSAQSSQSAGTNFDLVLRSQRTLSVERQQDIRAIFAQGAELTGYRGQILFHQTTEFPDTPMESFTAAMPGWTA